MLKGCGNGGTLFLTFAPILLIVFVTALLVLMVSACAKFTKGPLSTAALLQQLQRLQAKFVSAVLIDPEVERKEMETLQNKIKTSSDPAVISRNPELKRLFRSNCGAIQAVLNQSNLENRTSWIKLRAVMVDFNAQYFEK